MKHRGTVRAGLSVAVGLAFAMLPVSSVLAVGSSENVACFGVNSCKGHGACKTSVNACNGKNACKAQGFLLVSWNMCQKMGGSLQDPHNPSETKAEE